MNLGMLRRLAEAIRVKFEEVSRERSETPELISFLTLRKSIGWLGCLLPFVLILGSLLFGDCHQVQPSISHYYFTNMREVFVGILCAVGLFLFSYRGHSRLDSISANLAGVFGLGVAVFPTDKIAIQNCQTDVVSFIQWEANASIHYSCAALFFLTLAFMSLFLFTKSKYKWEDQTPEKRGRNLVYKVCGYLMIFSIAIIAVRVPLFHADDNSRIVFWFETLALLSFGISWLTKGEALLRDKLKTVGGH